MVQLQITTMITTTTIINNLNQNTQKKKTKTNQVCVCVGTFIIKLSIKQAARIFTSKFHAFFCNFQLLLLLLF